METIYGGLATAGMKSVKRCSNHKARLFDPDYDLEHRDAGVEWRET
jgi:hypothetical protein